MIDVLAAILLVLPVFDWTVAIVLVYLAKTHPGILTLKERAVSAVALAIVASLAAVLAFVRFGVLDMANELAITIIAVCLVAVSVPAMIWLTLLLTGRFRLPRGTE